MSLRAALQDDGFRRKVQEAFASKIVQQVLRLAREDTMKPLPLNIDMNQRVIRQENLNGERSAYAYLLSLADDAPVSINESADYGQRDELRKAFPKITDEELDALIARAEKEEGT